MNFEHQYRLNAKFVVIVYRHDGSRYIIDEAVTQAEADKLRAKYETCLEDVKAVTVERIKGK